MSATLFGMEQDVETSDDYYTPASVFQQMGIEFDLDVASPPGGLPWIPAKQFYTMADDGLAQPWTGRVWMNPPYSNPTPWVSKFVTHRHGVCLVPHTRSKWHLELWNNADALAHPGRFYFHARREIFQPVVFAAFGPECVEAISRLGAVRILQ